MHLSADAQKSTGQKPSDMVTRNLTSLGLKPIMFLTIKPSSPGHKLKTNIISNQLFSRIKSY